MTSSAKPDPPDITQPARSGLGDAALVRSQWGANEPWVEVSRSALVDNAAAYIAEFAEDVGLIVSIKKDACGHGLVETARALEPAPRLGAFGVWSVEELASLRAAGIEKPVLMFSVLHGEEARRAIELGAMLTITDLAEAREVAGIAEAQGREVAADLKIDTGMTRLGHPAEELTAGIEEILGLDGLKIAALSVHFANAWDEPDDARRQLRGLRDWAREVGLGEMPIHAGGSDALALKDELAGGAVRAGIAIFGYHAGLPDLAPAMTFKARVIYRRRAARGARVSYGGWHTLTRDSELALVGVGYGAGYPIALSGKGEVLIRGARYPVLGRVCMDQIVVDLTDGIDGADGARGPGIAIGEEVVLFGRQGEARLGADELARSAGTIPNELTCLAGRPNPRIFTP